MAKYLSTTFHRWMLVNKISYKYDWCENSSHPVFISQHATATCCRGCLSKWHKIPSGRDLTEQEIDYVVSVIMAWIYKEMKGK